ncbi:MAG: phosphatase PAP2 family protein [Archangium sp.]|nr:phosphatase PAP2 family protein [Archangium sp.]
MSGTLHDWRLPLDEPIFHAINGYENAWLEAVYVSASSRTFGISMLVLVSLWALFAQGRRAWSTLVQLGLTVVSVDQLGHAIVKPFVGRMRPSFALDVDAVRVLAPAANVGSMPSLHAANAFAVATVMTLVMPRVAWPLYFIAALIAVSRVGVGVHWPSDIAAGALFGSAVGAGIVFAWRALFPHTPAADPAKDPANG